MDGIKKSAAFLVALTTASLIVPVSAGAYFERMHASSRTLSMGGAFVAVASDPSAAIVNPAGLAQCRTFSFLTSLNEPYGLSDLEESYFAVALPAKIGIVGLSWHRFSLEGVSSEDLFSLAFGRDYIRTSLDASLSFGGSIDVARISYSDRFDASEAIVTGSLGVLLRPFPIIGVGYSVRNLGQDSFDFIPGGGGTPLKVQHNWGIAYHWQRVSFVYERERGQDRGWRNRMGLEVRLPTGLRIRSGLNRGDVTGGVGLLLSGLNVDIGVSSHDVLGTSYMISVGYSLPHKGAVVEPKR
ncbi:MAG: hypothetical protein GTO51_01245 [Candidatus Latescibacteria bacterium]|nr:hypothetical protein [Candidatus Latescibacterota bacterium]NIM21625.1 hypothetical protein [Candidatus Latescibacterota bacterium]NIM64604.1 hypothetical protein [Candidatus Latescibacterota bacterium]NIO01119.1 hypothetical protein [Candidatus Latescibacterota bacterium]NIO27512.1 hypothetical protein [Candidatus Latescibacterota bacterium]